MPHSMPGMHVCQPQRVRLQGLATDDLPFVVMRSLYVDKAGLGAYPAYALELSGR